MVDFFAIVTGSVGAAVGWLVSHQLALHKDRRNHQLQSQLQFVERQIEEFYGPLAASLYEGRRTFQDLLDYLGREYVFLYDQELTEEELRTWLYWVETDFLPRNEYIKNFHCNSWAVRHRRWKDQQVEYNWRSTVDWPEEFESQVIANIVIQSCLASSL